MRVHGHDRAQHEAAVRALLDLRVRLLQRARGAAPRRAAAPAWRASRRRPRPRARCRSARTAPPRTRSPCSRRAVERAGEVARAVGERLRHLRRLVRRLVEQVVERVAAEVEAALERAVDAHVEPALDAAADELDRHRVDERARQHGDQREQEHEAHREPRAEDAGLEVAPQPPQLPADDQHEQRDQHAVEDRAACRSPARRARCSRWRWRAGTPRSPTATPTRAAASAIRACRAARSSARPARLRSQETQRRREGRDRGPSAPRASLWTACARSRHEAPAVPVGRERPLARRERVDLERLRQLVDVEPQADRRVVPHALGERVGARDRPRRHAADVALDFLERTERLREQAAARRGIGASARCTTRGT